MKTTWQDTVEGSLGKEPEDNQEAPHWVMILIESGWGDKQKYFSTPMQDTRSLPSQTTAHHYCKACQAEYIQNLPTHSLSLLSKQWLALLPADPWKNVRDMEWRRKTDCLQIYTSTKGGSKQSWGTKIPGKPETWGGKGGDRKYKAKCT